MQQQQQQQQREQKQKQKAQAHSNQLSKAKQQKSPQANKSFLSATEACGAPVPASAPRKPVKMTELLASFATQLSSQGKADFASDVADIARGYRAGEISYQQAMQRLTDVVGRPALVAEVCRLSNLASADQPEQSTAPASTSTTTVCASRPVTVVCASPAAEPRLHTTNANTMASRADVLMPRPIRHAVAVPPQRGDV
mmetsp:Transcript_40921/g.101731  ORF Transcript_40921/g.101731 Transcript_40921/m.101731 type:complete len:198 (-) Transcript_40921:394-987(-)